MPVECPQCGQTNDDDNENCEFCNASLVIPAVATSGLSLLQEGPQVVVTARKCPDHPDANVEVDGERLVCSECGHDLGRLESSDETPGAAPPEDGPELTAGSDPELDADKTAYLEVEGGQEIFFRGAYTTKVPFKSNNILVGRRDVMASHYPDIDLMMYRKLDPAISRRHLRFFKEDDKYFIEDLCNNNATFLNDYANKLNHERRELHHGDRVFVSMSLAFLFRTQD